MKKRELLCALHRKIWNNNNDNNICMNMGENKGIGFVTLCVNDI